MAAASCVVVCAQARFPMKYLDDVGGVGSDFDRRKSADLGLASVFSEEGVLRFEGRDRNGSPWHGWVPQTGGIGWTEVWTADFDHNGQPDLLIASHFPSNGRCVGRADLLFLLFDQAGRPSPWACVDRNSQRNQVSIPSGDPVGREPRRARGNHQHPMRLWRSVSRALGRLEHYGRLRSAECTMDSTSNHRRLSLSSSRNKGESG